MLAINDILAARDYSSVSDRALSVALDLAARTGATLHVLHAEVPYPAEAAPTEGLDRLREALRRAGTAPAEKLEAVPVRGEVRRDVAAAPAILQYAADEGVDLIALGTHGRRGTSRLRLGSVAAEVVRRTDRPVLTVWGEDDDEHSPPPAPPERILVPVDFSEYSREALRAANEWAALYGAQVDVLHVVEEELPPTLTYYVGEDPSGSGTRSNVKEKAQAELKSFVDETQGPAPETSLHVWTGKPASVIIDFVDERDVDLVTISTHGRTGLKRFFLGSVTERIIRHVHCPVLTVRAFGKSFFSPDPDA